MKNLLLLWVLVACQMAPNKHGIHGIRHEIPVSGQAEADQIIAEKISFLNLTYEQVTHPLLKFTKFSSECLSQISIGNRTEFHDGILSVSRIFYGKEFGTGLCPEQHGSQEGLFVLIYCRKQNKVLQIKCNVDKCGETKWQNEC